MYQYTILKKGTLFVDSIRKFNFLRRLILNLLLPVLLIFCSAISVFSQETIVEGVLYDVEQEAPLPYGNIIFKGTTVGTTTDIDGNFLLRTSNLTLDSLYISYLGYRDQYIIVEPGEKNVVRIEMISNSMVMEEFVVTGKRRTPKDTAAITLYRNVVKHKVDNKPSEYDFYQYSKYEKSEFGFYGLTDKFKNGKLIKRFPYVLDNIDTLENGTEVLPILLKESAKDVFYRKNPKKTKIIIKADKFSGVEEFNIGALIDQNFEAVDVYDNILRINEKGLQSPFSNNAQFNYKFFLTDTAVLDGMYCYKLQFTGRNKQDAAFSGYAWVHDTTYAIKNIRLSVLPKVNLNFIKDLVIEQSFERIDGKYWFKNFDYMQSQYNIITNENEKKDKEKQSLLVRRSEMLTNISVNVPIEDQVMKGDPEEVLTDARVQSDSFWNEVRTEELKKREHNIYVAIDSIKGSRFYKALRYVTYLGSSGWFDAKYIEFGRLYQMYSWNDVEGKRVRLDIRTRDALTDKIALGGYGAYGFKDKQWKYGANFLIDIKPKDVRWQILGGKHFYDMSTITSFNPIMEPGGGSMHDDIIAALFRKDPLDDLFFLRSTEFFYEKEWIKHLNTRMSFRHQQHFSVPSGISFLAAGNGYGLTDSAVINKFTTSEITFNLAWGKSLEFLNFGLARYPRKGTKPVFLFDYTAGLDNVLGSDFAYHKFNIGMRQKLLGPIGYTIYRIEAGYTLGGAPYSAQKIHPGNESFLYDQHTFNVMGESEFVSSRYANLWIIHHFDGTIFNKIPLINKLQLRSIFTYKVLLGDLENNATDRIYLPDEIDALNGLYMEMGFGIENILKILRVDFIWRMTQKDQPGVDKFGFRFSIAPNF